MKAFLAIFGIGIAGFIVTVYIDKLSNDAKTLLSIIWLGFIAYVVSLSPTRDILFGAIIGGIIFAFPAINHLYARYFHE